MYVIRATPTLSGSGEMIPQVCCGCGTQIVEWENAPAKTPGALFIRATCPSCNAKTNIAFTETSPGNWAVAYSYQAHSLVSPAKNGQ